MGTKWVAYFTGRLKSSQTNLLHSYILQLLGVIDRFKFIFFLSPESQCDKIKRNFAIWATFYQRRQKFCPIFGIFTNVSSFGATFGKILAQPSGHTDSGLKFITVIRLFVHSNIRIFDDSLCHLFRQIEITRFRHQSREKINRKKSTSFCENSQQK